ncbi:MAG: HAMP domain-containing histidine kinase [Chloroflexi bacterium]|nr:HAMP domain-containing histidine kinase [Chloroflexota bacterium]
MSDDCQALEAVFHSLECTFFITDDRLQVIRASEEAKHHQPLVEALPLLAGMEDVLTDVAQERVPPLRMLHVRMISQPDDPTAYVNVHVAPYPPTRGVVVILQPDDTTALTIQELTQQRNELSLLRERLEQANRRLQELDEERTFLIAMINHDIRAPLATIITGLSYLLEADVSLTEEQRHILEMGLRAARSATSLANRILQVEKTHQMEHHRPQGEVNLLILMREVTHRYQEMAEEAQVTLHLHEATVPPVQGDWQMLQEAFSNVVENAIKYNRPGGEVHMYLKEEGEGVLVEIRDTGEGIPEEEIELLFQPFYRSKRHAKRLPGTGLGLYISRRIIHLHRGRIWIESQPGEGSRVFIWLPATTCCVDETVD